MEKELISGVIVTFNRKELLLKNLQSQQIQSRKLDHIIVIDNAGTDETQEFLLKANINFDWITFIRLEKNIGCAGAFALGIKTCFDQGYDWAYVMDDDGRPMDEHTISNLMKVVYSKNLNADEKVVANSVVLQSEQMLCFKLFETFDLNYVTSRAHDGVIEKEAKMWNGSLISRSTYYEIGGPNADFGFKGEEVDFRHRCLNNGVVMFTALSSRYTHPAIKEDNLTILGRKIFFSIEPDWKYYYIVRNRVYMLRREKHYMRSMLFYYKFRLCVKKLCPKTYKDTYKVIKKAYHDAKCEKLGLVTL